MEIHVLVSFFLLAPYLISSLGDSSDCCVDYCYSNDTIRPHNVHTATKTAYQLIRGRQRAKIPPGCTITKFWLLSRHGTRFPTSSQIQKMEGLYEYQEQILENYKNGTKPEKGSLCDGDLELLATWKWNTSIHSSMDEYLTEQGWNDLKGIAQHYKAQYPALLNRSYSAEKFLFRHTDTQRTQASYQAFLDGLFGDNAHRNITPLEIPKNDTLLMPYEHCIEFEDQESNVVDGPTSEVSKFKSSPLYLQVIKDVSTKAGYATPLKEKEIRLWYDMCIFELAWNVGKTSPWCSLFSLDQVKIFEYAIDLRKWYLSGPSSTLNTRLTCELVQDMLTRLDSLDGQPAIAYFSHSTTLKLFLTALGVAVDDLPLLADNYEAQANRKWQTSKISPFATNVAVVRYDCPTGTKVQFWLNERPIQFDWCDNGLCNWSDVKKRYSVIDSSNCSTYFCSTEN